MRKFGILLLCVCMLLSVIPATAAEGDYSFTEITLSNDYPMPGEEITINAQIKNNTSSTWSDVAVSVTYEGEPVYETTIARFVSSSTQTIETTWTAPADFAGGELVFKIKDDTANKEVKYGENLVLTMGEVTAVKDPSASQEEKGNSILSGTFTVGNKGNLASEEITAAILSGGMTALAQEINPFVVAPADQIEVPFTTIGILSDNNNDIPLLITLSQEGEEVLRDESTQKGYIRPNAQSIEVLVDGEELSGNIIMHIGDEKNITASVLPQGSENTVTMDLKNTLYCTLEDDVLTAKVAGNVILTVKAMPDDIKRDITIQVLPPLKSTDIVNIAMEYQDSNGDFQPLDTKPQYVPSTYNYMVHVDYSVRTMRAAITPQDESEAVVVLRYGKNNAFETVDNEFAIGSRTGTTFRVSSTLGTISSQYDIQINRNPVFDSSFPEQITIFKDLECKFDFTNYYMDPEDDTVIRGITVTDADGNLVGNVRQETINEKARWIWTVKSTILEMRDLTFTLEDRDGGKTSKIVPVETSIDTQAPTFRQGSINITSVTTGSAMVSCPLAMDNDQIQKYIISYVGTGVSSTYTEEVTPRDQETVATLQLRNLMPGIRYTVTVKAQDRSGNISNAINASFVTENSGGSQGGGGGGGIPPVIVPTPTPTVTPQPTPTKTPNFVDMDGQYEWAADAVYALRDLGIVNGTSDTTYSPGNDVIRADFILLLMNALGMTSNAPDNFADVYPDDYYYNAVGLAKEYGYVLGDDAGNFRPQDAITRQDMFVMVYRVLMENGYLQDISRQSPFNDADQIVDYAREPIEILAANGLIAGDENYNVNPWGHANRAETAVLIYRIYQLIHN